MKAHLPRLAALAATVTAIVALFGLLAVQPVFAVDFFEDACQGAGAQSAACHPTSDDPISGTDGIILRAATLISVIAGIAAVIVIMIAGIMFITAGGDSSKVSTAKKTLVYTVVGLVVIVLARTIIAFVIGNV